MANAKKNLSSNAHKSANITSGGYRTRPLHASRSFFFHVCFFRIVFGCFVNFPFLFLLKVPAFQGWTKIISEQTLHLLMIWLQKPWFVIIMNRATARCTPEIIWNYHPSLFRIHYFFSLAAHIIISQCIEALFWIEITLVFSSATHTLASVPSWQRLL